MGQLVFSAEDAEAWHAQGKAAILVHTFMVSAINILEFGCCSLRANLH